MSLFELKRIASEATDGPWGWRGHSDQRVELRTLHSGQKIVLSAMIPNPCTAMTADGDYVLLEDACMECKIGYRECPEDGWFCSRPENKGALWVRQDGVMRPINDYAVQEVTYRTDVVDVNHPDAKFISTFNPTVVRELLDTIDEQDRLIAELSMT